MGERHKSCHRTEVPGNCGLGAGVRPEKGEIQMADRSTWKGSIGFGMVNIPIKLYTATGCRKGGKLAIQPMLAKLAEKPFDSDAYLFDWKYNGMRIIGRCNGTAMLQGRSGLDYTAQFPELQHLAKQIQTGDTDVDGEVVCLDDKGLPNFNRLQNRIGKRDPLAVKIMAEKYPATFMVFDAINVDGKDLTAMGLRATQIQRKEILQRILVPDSHIQLAPWVDGRGIELYQLAEGLEQEGIMAKAKTGLYHPGGRGEEWQKLKIPRTGYFVIGGYTQGTGWRTDMFGALVLGLPQEDGIHWVGNAGTGFTSAVLADLFDGLQKIRTNQSSFISGTKVKSKTKLASWIQPLLIAEVKYGDLTKDGMLIWPSFQTIRTDLDLKDCCYRRPSNGRV